jgi:transforming growth factor-beta-induced protein
VVPGELTADTLEDGQELKTVEGETLTVSISGGTVKIDDAAVVRPDVDASNGVAHVIDAVLTPSG